MCVTETWLNNNITNRLLDPLAKFEIYRLDRRSANPGGGVLHFCYQIIIVIPRFY